MLQTGTPHTQFGLLEIEVGGGIMMLDLIATKAGELAAATKTLGGLPGALAFTIGNIAELDSKLTTTTHKPSTPFWNPYATGGVQPPVVKPGKQGMFDIPLPEVQAKMKPLVSVVTAGANATDKGLTFLPGLMHDKNVLRGINSLARRLRHH